MVEQLSIKEQILTLYPSVDIHNEMFFKDQRVLTDFTLEEIAFKLCALEYDTAWNLFMHLYSYGHSNIERALLKFLIRNDSQYFNQTDAHIYLTENMLKEYVKIFGGQEFTKSQYLKEFSSHCRENRDRKFVDYDVSYYNSLIMVQKLYREEILKITDLSDFISFHEQLFRKSLIYDFGNFDNQYNKYIHEVINYLICGNITLFKYHFYMSYGNNRVRNLLAEGKFGINLVGSNKFSLEEIGAINSRKIRNIEAIFKKKKCSKQLLERYNKDMLIAIFLKMSCFLKEENVDNIIRHLPDDVRSVMFLFSVFQDIDVFHVKVKDGNIIYKDDFIRFFMGDNFHEENSLLNLIYQGKTNIGNHLEEIYYYWESLNERCKNQNLQTRMAFLENYLNNKMIFLNPDEFLLEGEIINDCYDNRKYQKLSPYDMVQEIRKIYREMRHYYQKTIPYVSGEVDDYSYETLRANDPILFTMGSKSNCCFKIGGDADSFVKYCAINKNGRVVVIRNRNSEVIAMIPMVRTGNLIVCNSIESRYMKDRSLMQKMFEVLEEIGKQMIDISSNNEEESDRIQSVMVGNYKNEIEKFKKYPSVELKYGSDFDKVSPLDYGIYANLGIDSGGIYCITSDDRFDFFKVRNFDSNTLYDDPRKEVYEIEVDLLTEERKEDFQKKIGAISYENKQQAVNLLNAEKLICNDDWFIVIDKKHQIYSSIVGKDARAFEEYEEYLNLEREYCQYYDENGFVREGAKYR